MGTNITREYSSIAILVQLSSRDNLHAIKLIFTAEEVGGDRYHATPLQIAPDPLTVLCRRRFELRQPIYGRRLS